MRKCIFILLIAVITAFALSFSGCSEKEQVFREGTVIDGIDVSGNTVEEVKAGIIENHEQLLSELHYTVTANNLKKDLSAEELGISFDTEAALSKAMDEGGEIKTKLILDEEKARKALKSVSDELSKEPIEARAEYDVCGEYRFYKGENGSKPNIDALISVLNKSLTDTKSVELIAEMSPTYPKGMSYSELVEKNSLIAEFTTYFNHSPHNAENRVNNIKKAAEKVNGTVVKAGERFDTNAVLGPRNEENGWYQAPGIRDGKYHLEYGGGVCQISTTIYNTVLLSNLKVIERSPHSWPVGYIDIGRDATISTDGPNLIFENNTGSPITVAAIVNDEELSLTVRIFGVKPTDYARIEITSEQTGTIPAPATEYVKDKSLRIGEYVTDRKARTGKTAETYRTFYDENGNVLRTETVSKDTYRAFSAIVHYNN